MNDTCEWKIKWDGCMEHYLWINIEFEKPNEIIENICAENK